jgi:hypothetical protein
VLVAAHLAAGQSATSRRDSDWRHIEKSLLFEPAGGGAGTAATAAAAAAECPPTRAADIAVFFGDLNYRLELPPEETVLALRAAQQQEEQQGQSGGGVADTVAGLLQHDQLTAARSTGDAACTGWLEEAIQFPPTYKYQQGSAEYDIAPPKARAPSWTDRILFRAKDSDAAATDAAASDRNIGSRPDRLSRISGSGYSARAEPDFQVSDHRPGASRSLVFFFFCSFSLSKAMVCQDRLGIKRMENLELKACAFRAVTLLLEAALPTEAELLARDLRLLGSYLAAAAAPGGESPQDSPPAGDGGAGGGDVAGRGRSRDRLREHAAVLYYTQHVEVGFMSCLAAGTHGYPSSCCCCCCCSLAHPAFRLGRHARDSVAIRSVSFSELLLSCRHAYEPFLS